MILLDTKLHHATVNKEKTVTFTVEEATDIQKNNRFLDKLASDCMCMFTQEQWDEFFKKYPELKGQ
jgi:hypothetical protein